MTPHVEVSCSGIELDPSVEAAIHRWVARLASLVEVRRVHVTVALFGERRKLVRASLELIDGTERTAATVHHDVFVSVAGTFRTIHQNLRSRRARIAALAP